VRQCYYSVPARYAGRRLDVRLGATSVVVLEGGAVVAQHTRSAHKGTEDLVLDHYLEVLPRKPGALAGAPALVRARAAESAAHIVPIDSEHSAIFQCLQGEEKKSIRRLMLTASGGAFKDYPLDKLEDVSVEQALAHPTWSMGRKITVDSATLVNKGLEVIEAHWLFGVDISQIGVVIHPQSIVHSMVEFIDGSIMAQMGVPDMRLPIQYALLYPERLDTKLPRLDITSQSALTFTKPDPERYPGLELAYWAAEQGGTMPVVLNAANEVVVALFLEGRIGFLDIVSKIRQVMEKHTPVSDPDLPQILEVDSWAREMARSV